MMLNDVSANTHNLYLKNRKRLNRHNFFRCCAMLSSLFDPAELNLLSPGMHAGTDLNRVLSSPLGDSCVARMHCLTSLRKFGDD